MYNMYDVVLPTTWCWRRYKGHSCTNDDRTSSTSTSCKCARSLLSWSFCTFLILLPVVGPPNTYIIIILVNILECIWTGGKHRRRALPHSAAGGWNGVRWYDVIATAILNITHVQWVQVFPVQALALGLRHALIGWLAAALKPLSDLTGFAT